MLLFVFMCSNEVPYVAGYRYSQEPQAIKEIFQHQGWDASLSSQSGRSQRPKTIQEVVTAFSSMPELVGKTLLPNYLLPKTPQALITGHEDFRLDLCWKLPPFWLALGGMQTPGRESPRRRILFSYGLSVQ